MWNDIRFAGRMMRRAPGFTLVAVVVLALGIGSNTAIFSLVKAILLQPLPFAHPNQLVQMYETGISPGSFPLSGPDFLDWKAQAKLFSGMTLYSNPQRLNLTSSGEPAEVIVASTEANFFSLLGVKPTQGRMFVPGEDQPGAKDVAVLSYALWKSRFAGTRNIVGRKITLAGNDVTVVGVAPASFQLRSGVQLWTPMNMSPGSLSERGNHSYDAIGRLKPGVKLAAAQAEISAIAARLARTYNNLGIGAQIYPLRDRLVLGSQRASLITLLGVVGLVLLIACADLANLLLARALGRQKEISVRLALGARRSHIVRQLLTESVLLALCGAAVGTVLAWLGVHAVVGLKAFTLPQFNPIHVDGAVLAFTVVLAVVCGVLFGLVPAWQLSRPRIAEMNGAGSLAGTSRRRRWLSEGLIVAEVALSMLLVVAAGLFIQSFTRLRSSALGLTPAHLLTAELSLPRSGYASPASAAQFRHSLLQRLGALPGIEHAALSKKLPLEGGSSGYISLQGESTVRKTLVEWAHISPGFFATLQIPVLHGSGYTQAESAAWSRMFMAVAAVKDPDAMDWGNYHLPVIVNQAMAEHFFPGRNPIGQHFRHWTNGPWLTIQGVVGDSVILGLGDNTPKPQVFFPSLVGSNDFFLEVRSRMPPAALSAGIRRVVASLDSSLPLFNVRTMDQVVNGSVAAQAFQEWLMTGFAVLALLLAIAGIYGVTAYLVAARRRRSACAWRWAPRGARCWGW